MLWNRLKTFFDSKEKATSTYNSYDNDNKMTTYYPQVQQRQQPSFQSIFPPTQPSYERNSYRREYSYQQESEMDYYDYYDRNDEFVVDCSSKQPTLDLLFP